MPGVLRQPRLVLVGLAFFLSGAAALAYQVAWQRILALQTGVGLYSIALIVAAFMVGLGLGSHLGASASTRVPPSRALALFAACELAIAAFGALSCTLYYDWLYVRWDRSTARPCAPACCAGPAAAGGRRRESGPLPARRVPLSGLGLHSKS